MTIRDGMNVTRGARDLYAPTFFKLFNDYYLRILQLDYEPPPPSFHHSTGWAGREKRTEWPSSPPHPATPIMTTVLNTKVFILITHFLNIISFFLPADI